MQTKIRISALTALLLLALTVGQAQPVGKKQTISRISSIAVAPKINVSLSPEYVNSTKKYIKSTAKTLVASSSAGSSSVKFNKGGSEGVSDKTTVSQPAATGAYTCVTRSVNTTADYFRQPMFENQNFVFPGAFFEATDIINGNLSFKSVPAGYTRQPYRISANLFTMVGTPANPTEMIGDSPGEDYSLASYRTALSLILNRNANANPPVEAFIEYLEANTKEEVAVKLGYNFKANIPAELVAALTGIPIGLNQTVEASVLASTSSDKSRLILKINYNFYSVNASPTDEDPHKLISPAPGNNISNNLVFVSSVLYGTTGYVYFESDKTFSELTATLSETIGASGPLNQGSVSIGLSAETRAKFTSTVTKMVAFGRGLGINPGTAVNVTSLDQLLSLIGNLKNWGPNNQGSPIAYTMQFLKENVQAVVSYNTQFPNKVCTAAPLTDLKFDVDLELDKLSVDNINSGFGSHEELYGRILFTDMKAGSKSFSTDVEFWKIDESDAGKNSFTKGARAVDVRRNIAKNLTFNELKNIVLQLGGQLHDDEGVFGSRNYQCDNCNEFSGALGKIKLNFNELPNLQTSLNGLVNNGNYQLLKIGSNEFINVNYFESGKQNEGWVKVMWKVWVLPHN